MPQKKIVKKFNYPIEIIEDLILSIDDLFWKTGLKSIFTFLPDRKNLENKHLKSGEKPKMSKNEKHELIKFYANDVKNLQVLLGRDLPWKNFEDILK